MVNSDLQILQILGTECWQVEMTIWQVDALFFTQPGFASHHLRYVDLKPFGSDVAYNSADFAIVKEDSLARSYALKHFGEAARQGGGDHYLASVVTNGVATGLIAESQGQCIAGDKGDGLGLAKELGHGCLAELALAT